MSLTPATPRSREGERIAALGLVRQLQSAIQQDNRAVIVDLVRQLVEASAPLGAQWIPLANVAAQNGEVNLARQAIDLYVAGSQGDPGAYYKKVGLLLSAGAWDEALALLRSLPVTVPDPASYAYSRGTVAMYVGELDEARHWLEEAIGQHPQIGSPWLSLSVLANFAQEPELADRIVAAERQMQAAVPDQRGTYYYALGKAHADLGDHARAFAGFERGARLLKGHFAYSRERDEFTARDAVNGYTSERLADLARLQSAPTGRAIFVMGLPRSGTTLVEQILTSHSAVADGGEICRLPLLVKDVGGLSYLAIREYVDKGGAPEAEALWHHWLDERFPSPGRVVDKTVNTTRLLGLAAALLPDAPLIWLVRDPLDCALSCFRTRFAGEAPWSYDLEDIAFHFRLEDELLAQWRQTLGERLLVVPYESLVADPPAWIGRILAHCGLAKEAQPFAPHENVRPVTTSSVMQVRRHINRQGIGSAEPYREFLEPFIAAYYR